MITGHTFTMTITPDELKQIIREVFEETDSNDQQGQNNNRLYTRDEACGWVFEQKYANCMPEMGKKTELTINEVVRF